MHSQRSWEYTICQRENLQRNVANQLLWGTAVLKCKVRALDAEVREAEKSQINNLQAITRTDQQSTSHHKNIKKATSTEPRGTQERK